MDKVVDHQEVEVVDVEAQKHKTLKYDAPKISKMVDHGITLKFKDIVYKVKLQRQKWITLKKQPSSSPQERVILKGVSGLVKPGEMLAMLGPSGSGKTTLLTALGGRLGGTELKGTITYNGNPFTNQMKRNTGFVTQDDVLHSHLTVKETLVYTALLRLPNNLTIQDKITQAEDVILQIGLQQCKDTIIGGSLVRGVSGGERKRVSIAQEMLINPSLLFLDEPTSGLDSTTAQRMVSMLSDLAHGGRTIVLTIHQPSGRVFYMFDKIFLLSEGNGLYFGSGAHAMEHFENIGYVPSVPMNPADFLLDLANGVSPDDSEDQETVKQKLISAYNNIADKLKAELHEENNDGAKGNDLRECGKWPTTWWQQFMVLLRRGLKENKHRCFDFVQVTETLIVAFIAGLLWWQSKATHIQDRLGLLFFSTAFWGSFALVEAIFTFPPEQLILKKERSSGMYRLSPYFIAQIASELPMKLILPTCFVTTTYWMAGLEHKFISFLYYLFTMLLNILVSQSLGLALGAIVMDLKSATTIGSVIMLAFLLAAGFYVQNISPFISWIKYLSIYNHIYKMLLGSQYKPKDTYPCGNQNQVCFVEDFPSIKAVGLQGQLLSLIIVVLMYFFYQLIAYVALMRVGVIRRKMA